MAAGAINAVAGGGTLVSYPALLWAGLDAIVANTTSTVALLPGSLGGALGFGEELRRSRRWLRLLALPSLVGGLLGALLLLETSPTTFRHLVPYLILGATVLMAVQDPLRRRLRGFRLPVPVVIVFQLAVGIYGGFFGAGIGILMLAGLIMVGMEDIHEAQAVKNLLALAINGVSAVYFVAMGHVDWVFVPVLALGALAGGFLGARWMRRLDKKLAQRIVVGIGLAMALALFCR